jgi:hypothetical protein
MDEIDRRKSVPQFLSAQDARPRYVKITQTAIAAVILLLATVSCTPAGVDLEPLERKLGDAEVKLQKSQQQIDTLQTRITTLERTNNWRDFIDSASGIAYLTPGSEGYSIIKMDVGFATVSLTNVEPYANGSRVALQFGNPTSANLTGTKVTIEWGKLNADGTPDNQNEKSREVTFNENLGPASWTTVHVILDGIPASQLGFVRVKDLTHTGMTLRRG